jgi:RNA polymerase sigma-70 factor (ECF subfamily)
VEPAANIIWEQLHDALRGFISKRVRNDAETEDILQEVFMRVHHRLDSLQERERVVSWVYQITRNAIIDYYRSAERRRELPAGLAIDITDQEGRAESDNTEAKYELAHCLGPMIHNLSKDYREAITLVELDGLTHQQAASRLGLSVPNMKSRVQRGRRQLRKMLDQCCRIELDKRRGVVEFEVRRPGSC